MLQILLLLLQPAAVAFCTPKKEILMPYSQYTLAKLPQLPQHSSPNTVEKAAKPVFPCLNKYLQLYFGHWIKAIQLPRLSCQETPLDSSICLKPHQFLRCRPSCKQETDTGARQLCLRDQKPKPPSLGIALKGTSVSPRCLGYLHIPLSSKHQLKPFQKMLCFAV